MDYIVLGDRPDYDEYLTVLKEHAGGKFPAGMRFLRSIKYEDMPTLYSIVANSGGLLLSTSLFESAPMIFIEAMACECPIVTTAVGGISEIIKDGVTGRLYRPGDLDGAVSIIDELTEPGSSAHRTLLTQAANRYVRQVHALPAVGAQYTKLIEHITTPQSLPAGTDPPLEKVHVPATLNPLGASERRAAGHIGVSRFLTALKERMRRILRTHPRKDGCDTEHK